jgi:hypothetical protein
MTMEYRIERDGDEFIAIDSDNETVGVYATKEEAKQDIERAKKDDAMYETAKLLFDIAVKAHMEQFAVDRATSLYWLHSASEVTA